MTIGIEPVADAPTVGHVEGRPASWPERAGAFGIDVLFGLAVLATALLIGWSAPPRGWLWWLCMVLAGAVLMAVAVNRLLLPAATGWSLGRSIFGIRVVDRDGGPVGPWRLLARDLAHLVDTVPLFLGWLWPLLDARGRTFADLIARTEVRRVDGPGPDLREKARAAVAGAAALAVALAGLGYLAVYRPQAAAAKTREQIAVEGPKIVADVLSYTVAKVDDDFAHAQSLVTDGYRPELTKQQDAVRKAGLVDNDYWSSNAAVVSATGDRATMVLLLQGQRGTAPKQRFITASLRASFEKSGSQWRVSDLTVLTPPKQPAPAPAAAPPLKPAPAPAPAPKPGGGR